MASSRGESCTPATRDQPHYARPCGQASETVCFGCAPWHHAKQACCTGKARQERSVYTSQGWLPLRGKACDAVGISALGSPSVAAPVPALTQLLSVQELPPSQVLARSHMFQVHPRPFSSSNTGPPHLVPGFLHKREHRRWQMGVGRGHQDSEQIRMSSQLEEGLQEDRDGPDSLEMRQKAGGSQRT